VVTAQVVREDAVPKVVDHRTAVDTVVVVVAKVAAETFSTLRSMHRFLPIIVVLKIERMQARLVTRWNVQMQCSQ